MLSSKSYINTIIEYFEQYHYHHKILMNILAIDFMAISNCLLIYKPIYVDPVFLNTGGKAHACGLYVRAYPYFKAFL